MISHGHKKRKKTGKRNKNVQQLQMKYKNTIESRSSFKHERFICVGLMTIQTFDITYHSISISMRCSFFTQTLFSHRLIKYSLIQPVTFLRVIQLTTDLSTAIRMENLHQHHWQMKRRWSSIGRFNNNFCFCIRKYRWPKKLWLFI